MKKENTNGARVSLSKLLKEIKNKHPEVALMAIREAVNKGEIPNYRSSHKKKGWIRVFPEDVEKYLEGLEVK